jgi:hypothetical protein
MNKFSYGISCVGFSKCFSRVIVSLIGPYSCLLYRMLVQMLIGGHCVLCILCVPGIFVLSRDQSDQYMICGLNRLVNFFIFGLYYVKVVQVSFLLLSLVSSWLVFFCVVFASFMY